MTDCPIPAMLPLKAPTESLARRYVDEKSFAGIAWRLQHGDTIIEDGVVGFADYRKERPLTANALYRLYSMTKPVVSVAILQLVERGLLRLDDPLARFVPGFANIPVLDRDGTTQASHRAIIIEDLLTHRAGFSYDFLPDCPIAEMYREARLAEDGSRSLESFVRTLTEMPLAQQPGSGWYYSVSIDVLACVLQRVLDRPLIECLRSLLFDPLGMDETRFGIADDQQGRLVDMYGLRQLGEVPPGEDPEQRLVPMDVEHSYPSDRPDTFARGGIGLFSTLAEYARFLPVLMNGRGGEGQPLLSESMVDLLWQNRLPDCQRPIAIGGREMSGYGWGLTGRIMVDTGQALQLTSKGEGGWAGAASTHFWIDRQQQRHGIVMAQFLGSSIPLGPDLQTAAYIHPRVTLGSDLDN